jgi:hypothetical protein
MIIALLVPTLVAVCRKFARNAFLVRRPSTGSGCPGPVEEHILIFARDSRDVQEQRDWSEVPSSRISPVAQVLFVSLTTP